MTPKSPAFQFYPDSFVSGAPAFMKPLETHVYMWLLCLDWTRGGFVYHELDLASWCRIPVSQFRKAWPKVKESFVERDGRFYNPRLDREREKQNAYSERMAANGKKGGRPKAAVKPEESRSLAEANPEQSRSKADVKHSVSVSVSNPVTTTATTTPKQPARRTKRVEGDTPEATNGTRDRTSWLSPICAVWERQFGGGSFATVAGQAVKVIAPLVKADHAMPEIAERLAVYLAKTDVRFVNLTRFAQTYGDWVKKPNADENGFLTAAGVAAARAS